VSEWQPIETAPRSADPILIFNGGGRIRIETGHYAHNMLHASKVDGEECYFTHWMPLPQPPVDTTLMQLGSGARQRLTGG
jgi:hypothetical protein